MAQQKQKQRVKPVTTAQIKRIHILIHALGVTDENYRAALDSRFGVTSSKGLNLGQASSFIAELEELWRKSERKRNEAAREEAVRKARAEEPELFDELGNRPGMASAAQLRMIDSMWSCISIVPDPEARSRALRRFVAKIAKVDSLLFLDKEMASKVINALNAMKRQAEKAGKEPKPKKAR